MTLSKSNYMDFLKHPAFLWLRKRDKYKIPPIDDATQGIFDAGNLFESHVEELFPNATKIGFTMKDFNTYKSMPQRTKTAVADGIEVILQGRLEANNITCIFDVLRKVEDTPNADPTYDLIEIKSSSSAKPEHAYDLAFQGLVLEYAGIKIRNYSVIHLNSHYKRKGEINIKKLIIETDITKEVKDLAQLTKNQVKEAFSTLELTKCPDLSPKHINKLNVPKTRWKDYWMNVFFYINKNISPTSIYKLSRLNPELVAKLEDLKITDIKDIPEDLENLHPKQITQIQTTKSQKQVIDQPKIDEYLDTFKYPLYFFDYETFSNVIPMYDGMHPYKDYPFQYSLHILDEPGAELRHEEYLHSENSNPLPDLIKKLKKDIGKEGTILSWNMNYEKGCNERMAEIYPKHADFLFQLNERMEDLMIPFFNQWFIDKDFYGSASIKYVLPVLVPELNYSDLNISDGLKARRIWTQTILQDKNTWKKEEILEDLSRYCTLDTLAMVKILEKLNYRC